MNVLDIVIIIMLLLGMFYGLKQGFLKGTISFIGLALILFLSFMFKNNLADILLKTMPFFKFSGVYKEITSLNILIYEGISFLLIFMFLFGILSFILKITGIFQKIIDMSVVLTLPSKILSLVVGFINALITVFIMLFVLININSTRSFVYNSYISKIIMERTFILSNTTKDYYLSYEEINNVIKACQNNNNTKKCNTDVANIMIKYNIVKKDEVIDLIKIHKLKGINRKDLIDYD